MSLVSQELIIIKQFMSRKLYHPVDAIKEVIGPYEEHDKPVFIRIHHEGLDFISQMSQEHRSILFRDHPGYKEGDYVDLFVECVYIDPKYGQSYFSLQSNLPGFKESLSLKRFTFNFLPFLLEMELKLPVTDQ